MPPDFRPKLRALRAEPIEDDEGQKLHLSDPRGVAPEVAMPLEYAAFLALLDGSRSMSDLEDWLFERGVSDGREFAEGFVSQLDELLLLDSPRFHSHAAGDELDDGDVRAARFAGRSYPENPAELRAFLDLKFDLGRKRLAPATIDAASVRGIITPHIDFQRGGHVEAASYIPLVKNVEATGKPFDLFVVLGIAHKGVAYPFAATGQSFQTPFGLIETDRAFLDEISEQLPPEDDLFGEQWVHGDEHSLEFVAVMLGYHEKLPEAKIAPFAVGGFWDSLKTGRAPEDAEPEVSRFIVALRNAVAKWEAQGKKVGFIASVDGAHVGTQFGDSTPLTGARLEEIQRADQAWMRAVEAGDRAAFHAHFARDFNRFHVDAHPAVYTLMAAFPTLCGVELDYDQAFHPDQNIVVSFAALALVDGSVPLG